MKRSSNPMYIFDAHFLLMLMIKNVEEEKFKDYIL